MKLRRRLAQAACVFLAFSTLAFPVLAQDQLVGVSITPPRIETDLQSRAFRIPVRFQNHENEPLELQLSVSGLGHSLDGAPLFLEPAIATDAIQLSEEEILLAPGEAREVIATGEIPAGERSLYAAIIALFAPPDVPAGQIESRSRVASLLLLRGPRPWVETVQVVDVSVLQAVEENGPLQVFAAVENTGNVHVKPRGRVRLVKDGKTLDTVALPGQNIIPTYARRLLGDWRPPKKLTGRIKLVATIRDPDARAIGYVDFTPEGELAVPGMKIGNLVARDEGGPVVEFALTNTGTIPLAPTVSLVVSKNETEVAKTSMDRARMEPGASEAIQWRPEGLEEGVFLVSAEVSFREQLLDQAATGLKLEPSKIPAWAFFLAGGLLLVLLGLFLFRRRKKSKQEEDPEETESEEAA